MNLFQERFLVLASAMKYNVYDLEIPTLNIYSHAEISKLWKFTNKHNEKGFR